MKRVLLPIAAVALLASTGTLAQDEKKKDGKDERPPARPRDELLRAVLSADRKERVRAAEEARGAERFTEDDWLRVLDTRLRTDDEQEEMKTIAARGLFAAGTEKCIPRLLELVREQPKAVDVTHNEDDPRPRRTARYNYQYWAASALHVLVGRATFEKLNARLKDLAPRAKADALATIFLAGKEGWNANRIEGTSEEVPFWWRNGLVTGLAELGSEGMLGVARALERTEDSKLRGDLCAHVGRERNWDRDDPKVQAAQKEVIRAVLRYEKSDVCEAYLFAVAPERLAEMDEELIAAVRRRASLKDAAVDPVLSAAYRALGRARTARAVDFIISWEGPIGRDGGQSSPIDECPDLLGPAYSAALEREPVESRRFDSFAHCACSCANALLVPEDGPAEYRTVAGRIAEAVAGALDRLKKEHASAEGDDAPPRDDMQVISRKRHLKLRIESLEPRVEHVRSLLVKKGRGW